MKTVYLRPFIGFIFFTWAGLLCAQPVPEVLPTETIQGAAQDDGFGDLYGDHVATWDDSVFVGAPRELSARGERDGAVYVYHLEDDGLELVQRLEGEGNTAPGNFGDRLGAGLAAANGWLLAGVANDQSFPGLIDPRGEDFFFAGKVYVYRLNDGSWTKVQELTAPEPGGLGAFGGRTDLPPQFWTRG